MVVDNVAVLVVQMFAVGGASVPVVVALVAVEVSGSKMELPVAEVAGALTDVALLAEGVSKIAEVP